MTPTFGQWVEDRLASKSNPTHHGMFVRAGRTPHGGMNGRWWELTDGRGKFWQTIPDNCDVLPSVSAAINIKPEAKSVNLTGHDMGPSRPAALNERWEAVSLPVEHFRKMAESHWCAGWDCSTCITTKTIIDLAAALERFRDNFNVGISVLRNRITNSDAAGIETELAALCSIVDRMDEVIE